MTEQSSSKRAVADTDCVVDLMIRELLPVNKPVVYLFFSQQICICLFLLLFPRRAFCSFSSRKFLERPAQLAILRCLLRLHLEKQNKTKQNKTKLLENNVPLGGTKPRGKYYKVKLVLWIW